VEKGGGVTHPATKNLVNGSGLFECTLVDNGLSHLLHEDHEGVERLLDVLG